MSANLKLERHIPLTPAACFDLWTKPEEVKQWWGPKDDNGVPFQAKINAWNATVGGSWAITMIAPDGTKYFQKGKMLEVDRPHLLRFSFAWVQDGESGPETEVRVTFEPDGSKTRMIFEQIGLIDEATRDDHIQGWGECLDRLVAVGSSAIEPAI